MGNLSEDIQSGFANKKIEAFLNIKYTANWLNTLESNWLKPFDISSQQYNILRILKGAKDKMKVQKVKERMVERAPNITRLMDKLCEKELIERVRCNHDRRVVFVHISKKGIALLEKIRATEKIDFLKNITEQEATLLNNLLNKIRG